MDVGDLLHPGADSHQQATALVVVLLVAAHDGIGATPAGRGQVVAGAERPAFAAHDDRTDGVVRFHGVQRVVEFVEELLGQRVQLLRAVQTDAPHAPVRSHPVDDQVLVVSHGFPL